MPRIAELLKLKFEMAYRGMPKDKAETKFNEIVAPPPVEPPAAAAPTPVPQTK